MRRTFLKASLAVVALSAGAQHGFAASLRHVSGATVGFTLLLLLIGLGLHELLVHFPNLINVVKWAGVAFLLYMACKLALDDVQLAVAIARSKEPALFMISEETFSKPEPYGIMLRREDAPFKALADRATAELYASPEIEVLYKRWLESPTPPNGLNYNVPMSPALRNAYKKPSSSADPDVYVVN